MIIIINYYSNLNVLSSQNMFLTKKLPSNNARDRIMFVVLLIQLHCYNIKLFQ